MQNRRTIIPIKDLFKKYEVTLQHRLDPTIAFRHNYTLKLQNISNPEDIYFLYSTSLKKVFNILTNNSSLYNLIAPERDTTAWCGKAVQEAILDKNTNTYIKFLRKYPEWLI